jgi:hypothetical protein
VRLYHTTTTAAAAEILAGGFRDGEGTYGFRRLLRGVWLADSPVDGNEGAPGWPSEGDPVLAVDIPEELLGDLEVVEDGKGYREWLVPADLANQHRPYLVDPDEVARLTEPTPSSRRRSWPASPPEQRAQLAGLVDEEEDGKG